MTTVRDWIPGKMVGEFYLTVKSIRQAGFGTEKLKI